MMSTPESGRGELTAAAAAAVVAWVESGATPAGARGDWAGASWRAKAAP